ncbi:MAG: hypothetical protein LBM99_02055 [Bacillales bacterium]|jgi:hypothetical protein|nr:hypothetical protein [Bacillales bacterium]
MKVTILRKANIKTNAYGTRKSPEQQTKTQSNMLNFMLKYLYPLMAGLTFFLGILFLFINVVLGIFFIILGVGIIILGRYMPKIIEKLKVKVGANNMDQYDFQYEFSETELVVTALLENNPIRNNTYSYANLHNVVITETELHIYIFKMTYYCFDINEEKNKMDEIIQLLNTAVPEKIKKYKD